MKKENDNIISIPSASKSSFGKTKKDACKSKYIPPRTQENPSECFQLPSNDEIIRDFQLAGGSMYRMLELHIDDRDQRKAAGIAIVQQLKQSKSDWQQFEGIRVASEQVEAMLAKDELVALGKHKGAGQIQALKEVKAFTKDHPPDLVNDPIDKHLENIPDEDDDEG